MKKILAMVLLVSCFSSNAAQDPQAVFSKACSMCHNGQLPTAPAKGDQAAWKPRLEQGEAVLLRHVVEGLGVMPPRGMCMDCSDAELAATIIYLTK